MSSYLLRYDIEAHDSDGPSQEERRFESANDVEAKNEAGRIMAERLDEIRRRGDHQIVGDL